ncbi:MAG: CSLREA domain-containing protein, partial [Actinomycetota bacterium]
MALVLMLGVVTAVPGSVTAAEAQAGSADIVVNSAGDGADANPADGQCRTAAGDCTLRAAIQQANGNTGPDQIRFAIPGSGIKTIAPRTELPSLNDASGATVIDGFTQPGASANTAATGSNARVLIEVVGSGQEAGIRVESAGNTVRGLAISGFVTNVFLVGEGADGNRIVGNFIGARAGGGQGPTPTGVRYTWGVQLALGPDQNVIGAPTLADRNVISGNGTWGVAINHGETSQNFVQNNVIGMTPDLGGRLAQRIGIDIQWWTWGNLIGGDRALEGNLVSGNQLTTSDGWHAGIDLSHDAVNNQVIGNFIGTLGDGDSVAPHSA